MIRHLVNTNIGTPYIIQRQLKRNEYGAAGCWVGGRPIVSVVYVASYPM
jgi:hypothetical protein